MLTLGGEYQKRLKLKDSRTEAASMVSEAFVSAKACGAAYGAHK